MGNAISMYMRGGAVNANNNSSSEVVYDKLLNKILPPSIRIIGYRLVPDDFDARFSCRARSYRYFFDAYKLNLAKMSQAASLLVRKADFRNLCYMDVVAVSNFVREVYSATIRDASTEKEIDVVADASGFVDHHRMCYLDIRANAFLYHQIRCIMTVLISVGAELEEPSIVTDLLDIEVKFPRKPVYPLAEPTALFLWNCEYEWKNSNNNNSADDAGWKYDETTMKQTFLRELDFDIGQARVKAAACECMKHMMLNELNVVVRESPIPPTALFLFPFHQQTMSSAASQQHTTYEAIKTNCYVKLVNREKDKTYEEKVASLSGKRKERHGENMGKQQSDNKESGNRRDREEEEEQGGD